VLGAFVGLVLSRRYGEIRVGDIIANAGVARSTFYEHFRRKEDVLLAAMEPILLPLRDAANGHADQERLGAVLRHLWDKRALARILFESTAGPLIQRHLAEMIAPRLTDDRPAARALLSRACAAGQLTMLRMWLAGEVSCPSEQMAMHLCRIAPCEPAGIA
jgi:AcrR family transcriptional regulator